MVLSVLVYVLQGIRWHFLLADVGVIPGGVGANEASVAALLIFLVDYGTASAAAGIQRAW